MLLDPGTRIEPVMGWSTGKKETAVGLVLLGVLRDSFTAFTAK